MGRTSAGTGAARDPNHSIQRLEEMRRKFDVRIVANNDQWNPMRDAAYSVRVIASMVGNTIAAGDGETLVAAIDAAYEALMR
jgi:hypothetical protein